MSVSPDRTVASIGVPMAGSGTDAASMAGLRELRTEVVPAAFGRVEGVEYGVTGEAAVESPGAVVSWLPLFLFVILFGLSMDYHVFIVSRVREARGRGARTSEAVAEGVTATAGVVTSAMIAVFAIFATLGSIEFKMMGVGLATAILIDATIVRAVLLPATMKLLGEWNWYLPRRLEWLPRFEHDVVRSRPAVSPEPERRPLPV